MEHIPLVSVIVPIYKVEKYIKRCLDSIKAQTFQDYEVIMIDDGTPDNSAAIAEKYTADPRFKLYRQKNSGVGAVRNKAICLAHGEYLAFVDSDDSIFPNHLEGLCKAALENNADIVCCGYCCCDENGKHFRTGKILKRKGVYRAEELYGNIIRDISIRRYLWNKLFRKKLFTENDLYFPQMLFEDASIIPKLFYCAKTIAVTNDKTYVYTHRASGITGFNDKRCINDYLAANKSVEDYYLNTPEAEFYIGHMIYQRLKTASVTYCWLVIQIFKLRDKECFKENFAKINKYLTAPTWKEHGFAKERGSRVRKIL
ncbi:MAG: glycosyltransferase [Ruminococcaceae bacterium]|nr:glycosyltransferase [Oscillospiraceae bacterium]